MLIFFGFDNHLSSNGLEVFLEIIHGLDENAVVRVMKN